MQRRNANDACNLLLLWATVIIGDKCCWWLASPKHKTKLLFYNAIIFFIYLYFQCDKEKLELKISNEMDMNKTWWLRAMIWDIQKKNILCFNGSKEILFPIINIKILKIKVQKGGFHRDAIAEMFFGSPKNLSVISS